MLFSPYKIQVYFDKHKLIIIYLDISVFIG